MIHNIRVFKKVMRQAIAEAKQDKPVGRVIAASREYSTVQWLKQTSEIGGGDPKNSRSWPITGDAVYTNPQPRKPLTDEQIDDIPFALFAPDQNGMSATEALRDFAKAIEAAHGIKEST